MPTNITYKGSLLTTVNNNQAKILKTSGKYLEDDITISSALNLQGKTTSITPNTSTQTTTISPDSGYEGLSGVTITVNPIPSQYIIPAGTITITSNGTHDVSQYADADVSIEVDTAELPVPTISINSDNGLITSTVTLSSGGYIDASEKTATLQLETQGPTAVRPIEAVTTVFVMGKYMTGNIGIYGITPTYVGSSVTRNTELTVNGQTITAPSGYYANAITTTVQSATLLSPINFTSGQSPTVTVDSSGLVTATVKRAGGDGYRVVTNSGYISSTNAFVSITAPARTTTYQLDTQSATTIIPSETAQTLSVNQKYMTGDVTVDAITPTYVGSSVPRPGSAGLTYGITNGYFKVTAALGYYTTTTNQSLQLQNSTITPSETTQTVTPASSNRYIESVTVAAITPTYVGSSVPTGSLTVSGPTVTASAGYYADATTKTISNATLNSPITVSLPAADQMSVDANGLVSVVRNYFSQTKRPVTSNGYVSSTDSNAFISIQVPTSTSTYQLPVQAATTVTPSSATQTITGQKYMTGDITVQPIPSQYIVPSGTLTITSVDTTTTFDATSYASVNVNLKNADVTAY